MPVTRTLVFRAKLSKRSHAALEAFLEEMRPLWNAALEERIDAYRKAGVSIGWIDQFKSLTEIRRFMPEYARCSLEAQRSVLKRLDRAFQAFFRRGAAGEKPGFPRFRSRRRSLRSFEIPAPTIRQQGRWHVFSVKGIGKFRFKGEIEGKPRILRIVKTPVRVAVHLVVEQELPDTTDCRAAFGIDVGIRSRIVLSSEETVPGRQLDRSLLIRRQRTLSRAVRGSRSRCKKRQALAKAWQRTVEREHGVLHELTADLVREPSARFYVEDLRIPNLLRNRRLARSISEQNWGAFARLLTYKAEEAGGWVRKVPPHHTSQKCSACGALPPAKLTLAVRTYRCSACGHTADRDVNAAMNILLVGLALDPPGGTSPARRKAEDERDGCRKARRRVTAQNDIQRLAA